MLALCNLALYQQIDTKESFSSLQPVFVSKLYILISKLNVNRHLIDPTVYLTEYAVAATRIKVSLPMEGIGFTFILCRSIHALTIPHIYSIINKVAIIT